jgi:hypothetical protein
LNAIDEAGADPCFGIHISPSLVAKNMTVSADEVKFGDASILDVIESPNLVVHGESAQRIVDAFAAAGLSDCDRTRKLFLVCGTNDAGEASCGSTWQSVVPYGSATLQSQGECGPTPGGGAGPTLTNEAALRVWQAILTGAEDAGYQPEDGPIAEMDVINATFFQWDGSSLGFRFYAGKTPPTPPPPPLD